MSSNPTLDRFWAEFSAIEPSAELGGIDADKPGYHEKRNDIIAAGRGGDDYSVAHVAADRRGRGTVGSAIDLTMWPAGGSAMRKYTGRLQAAALSRDPRLYLRGGPTLREYIGTTNGTTVECYVFTGGAPLGVKRDGEPADSGFDYGRAASHLWHIHLSIIRQYAEDWGALDAVLSVLRGESLAAWRARTEDDMSATAELQIAWLDGRMEALGVGADRIAAGRPGAGQEVWAVKQLKAIAAAAAEQKLRDEAVLAAVRDDDDQAAILARIDARAAELAAGQQALRAELAAELAPALAEAIRAELGDVPAEELDAATERALRKVLGSLDAAPQG